MFGTDNPSTTDYNTHIRPENAAPASISYSMLDYMENGSGRFAYPSLFGAVEKFFGATLPIDGTYSYAQMASILGLTADDLRADISQYGSGIGSADHAERSYIFGNTRFELTTAMTFNIIGGVKSINGLEVRALPDGFNFASWPGTFSQLLNGVL